MGARGCDTGIYRAETRDATEHPTVPSAAPTTKNYLALNVKNAKFEKSFQGLMNLLVAYGEKKS